jgi:hypothetical protein
MKSNVFEYSRRRRGYNFKQDEKDAYVDEETGCCVVIPHPDLYLKVKDRITTAKEYKEHLKGIDWMPVFYADEEVKKLNK